jgi:diguanylate cyclase (GGDEF)-like protein
MCVGDRMDKKKLINIRPLSPAFNEIAELKQKIVELEIKNTELRIENSFLKEQVVRDPLTNLLNRRGFEEKIKDYLVQKERDHYNKKPKPSPKKDFLIYIDLTKFKFINDTYGHTVGDQALILVSSILQSNARKTDFVARIGGDEFCVFMKMLSESDLQKKIELINRILSESPLDNTPIIIQIDTGYTEAKLDQDLKEWIKDADEHMYKNKQQSS